MIDRPYVLFSNLKVEEQLQLFDRLYHRSVGELVDSRVRKNADVLAARTLLVLCRYVLGTGKFGATLNSRVESLNLVGPFNFPITSESLENLGNIGLAGDRTYYEHLTDARRDVHTNWLDHAAVYRLSSVYGANLCRYHNSTGWVASTIPNPTLDEDHILGLVARHPSLMLHYKVTSYSETVSQQLRELQANATR